MCAECENNELNEESLKEVAGGGDGRPSDPQTSGCWFHAVGEAVYRDGARRKKCNQFSCRTLSSVGDYYSWYICKCHGTDLCINSWHYEAGCPD